MKRLRVALPVVAVLACSGCWSTDSASTTPTTTSPTVVDAPCVPVVVADRWKSFVTACRNGDGQLEVANTSTLVLLLTAWDAKVVVRGPEPGTLVELGRRELMRNTPVLAPNHRLGVCATATVDGTTDVYLAIDASITMSKYAMDVIMESLEKRLTRPQDGLVKSLASCAEELGTLWASQEPAARTPVEVVLLGSAISYRQCRGFVQDVYSQADPPPPATFADDLRAGAKRLPSTLVDDAMKGLRQFLLAVR